MLKSAALEVGQSPYSHSQEAIGYFDAGFFGRAPDICPTPFADAIETPLRHPTALITRAVPIGILQTPGTLARDDARTGSSSLVALSSRRQHTVMRAPVYAIA